MDGEGVLKMADGLKYKGGFSNGMKHGRGILEDKEGVRYEGNFSNDMKNGEFHVRDASGARKVFYVNDRVQNL